MTGVPGVPRQAATVVMVVIAGLASLATSRECTSRVENDGSASLATDSALVVQRYRIFAPRGSIARAKVTIRSDEGASVRAALVADDPSLWADPTMGVTGTVTASTPGSSESATVELPPCTERGCADYAVTLELELLEGSQATVEWTAHAEIDMCDAERTDDDLYFEIRRD